MRKSILIGSIILILLLSSLIPMASSIESQTSKTIYVDDDGGADYTRIQDAIDNASNGDTIYVYNGTYFERIKISKTLTLIGENKNSTIIDGERKSVVVTLKKRGYTNLQGFTITGCGISANDAGILINSRYNNITENIIRENAYKAIHLSSSYNTIANNIIMNNGDGYYGSIDVFYEHNKIESNIIINDELYCYGSFNSVCNNSFVNGNIRIYGKSGNRINNNNLMNSDIVLQDTSNNIVYDNEFDSKGIYIRGDSLEHWNTHSIENNSILGRTICYLTNLKYGEIPIPSDSIQVIIAHCKNLEISNLNISQVFNGILIGYSTDISIFKNNISYNGRYGIYLYKSHNIAIFNNEILLNGKHGIKLEKGTNNEIYQNIIAHNIMIGMLIHKSNNTLVNSNSIMDNEIGISLLLSSDGVIRNNNFMDNSEVHAKFKADVISERLNKWNDNYWDDSNGLFPRIIGGQIKTPFYRISPDGHSTYYYYRLVFNFDLHPAQESYDIPFTGFV